MRRRDLDGTIATSLSSVFHSNVLLSNVLRSNVLRSNAFRSNVFLAALALAVPAHDARAQTLEGLILDRVNETAVGGAVVTLMSRDGATRAEALSDAAGRFTITPPWAGEYFVHVSRYAYADFRSPLLALVTEGAAPIELMLTPAPIRLEGLQVSVEERATDELRSFGVTPRDLGERWIDRGRIDANEVMRDIGSIIERASVPGAEVTRQGGQASGRIRIGLCVTLDRARPADGTRRCALMILDGVPVPGSRALSVDPESIAGVAVLRPSEAESFYGGLGGGGAILLWSRRPR